MNNKTNAMTAQEATGQPQCTLSINGTEVTIIGTAHVSRVSAETVTDMLASGDYDAVALELCPSRHKALVEPAALAQLDLFQVLRSGQAPMVAASLALSAFQQRMADQFGIEPGAEMRAALNHAKDHDLPVYLLDREIGVTLRRIYHNVRWWQRLNLLGGLFTGLLVREKISEEDIERLKEGDILESAFTEFAQEAKELYEPLIAERDRYMAARLRQETAKNENKRILAVVGAGHLAGIEKELAAINPPDPTQALVELNTLPVRKKWLKLIPWVIVAAIVTGFAIGFMRSPSLGWQLVLDWVLINGLLSALGALLALAHPLTIVSAFVAAPLTSLNPTIGAGMVTALVEVILRKPQVGDFSHLRTDVSAFRGWWRNRVTRVLLVFLFSTLGSAIGTYVAGFRILERLV